MLSYEVTFSFVIVHQLTWLDMYAIIQEMEFNQVRQFELQ